MVIILDTLDPTPPPGLELALELAGLERAGWRDALAALRARGIPLAAADDDDDTSDDDDDTSDDDDDDAAAARKRNGNTDDDDEEDEEKAKLERALAATNRELRKLKASQATAAAKAKEDAGKWEELYNEAKAEVEALKAETAKATKQRLVETALTNAGARNPARAARLLDLDDIDDASDAERAVKRLAKTDDYLFNKPATRQKGDAGRRRDDDHDDDDKNNGGRPRTSRLTRGIRDAVKTE